MVELRLILTVLSVIVGGSILLWTYFTINKYKNIYYKEREKNSTSIIKKSKKRVEENEKKLEDARSKYLDDYKRYRERVGRK